MLYYQVTLHGLQKAHSLSSKMTPTTTLPASWFQSTPLYQLERRAIFLNVCSSSNFFFSFSPSGSRHTRVANNHNFLGKAWHFVGPVTRFVNRGEKVYYEIAQVKFYVVNTSPEGTGWGTGGIEVHRDNDVSALQLQNNYR